ncbi:MAG: hypothetical protein JW714_01080 [Candidatus Omnitrophica bacterium]|nr:hypothetical protein [Candidatus Omnitrophota bacterium]
MMFKRRAQSTLEYATLIIVVAAACMAMFTYVNRAVNAHLRMVEQQVQAEPQ